MTVTAGLIYLSAALLSITGVIHGGDVDQDLQIWGKEGQNATMACSHKKDATYYQMYWFRQLPGKRMEQIVFTTTSPPHQYFPSFSEDKFPAERQSVQNGSLTVVKLLPADGGVYYCSSVSVKVTQTPADLFYTPGDTARINCSHDESKYDQILWYKKTNGTQMQLLGYMYYTKGYPEDKVNVTFEGGASKDQNCTLIIEKVDLSSSAVYFCAASLHGALHHCSSVQKPPLHYSPQTPAPGSLTPPLSADPTSVQSARERRHRETDQDIMIRILLLLLCFCQSLSYEVHQHPPSILGSPESTQVISCNHSVSTFTVILWYQVPTGDSKLDLIGYIQYKRPDVEEKHRPHFNITGDGSKRSELHVLKLRQEDDSGVFYCAASTQ
ncbi:uncharacterized protein LOC122862178 [Xyrichtys novacula]|uniref:Uncharacterized protein LOC122862178 n=1 Tax=Xyrichtys novacula TaxID=13765 RepID=A0AAV1GMN7_XYRNO|nr:uncharacterized protein LOC122862178 [Xyrichtys novacula]